MKPPRCRSSLLFLGALVVFTSCAKEEDIPPAPTISPLPIPLTPKPDAPSAQKAAEFAELECKEPGGCPSYVGLLAFTVDKGAGQCTAVAIGPRHLLTNAHCIPKDLQKGGSSCAGRMWFHFLVDGRQTKVGCSRVVEAIGGNGRLDQADYAFVEVEGGLLTDSASLSPQGLPSDEPLTLWKSNPAGGSRTIKGELVRAQCLVTHQTALAPDQNPTGPVTPLKGCEVRGGNSGSPLLDKEGRLRALVFGYVPKERIPSRLPRDKFILPSMIMPVAFASNLSCLRSEAIDENLQVDCTEARISLLRSGEVSRKRSIVEASLHKYLDASSNPELKQIYWRLSPNSNLEPAQAIELNALCIWEGRQRLRFRRPSLEFKWLINEYAEPIAASFYPTAWSTNESQDSLELCPF